MIKLYILLLLNYLAFACNSSNNHSHLKVDTRDCSTDVRVNDNRATVDVDFKGEAELVFNSSAGSHCPFNLQQIKCRPATGGRNTDVILRVMIKMDGKRWECLPCCLKPGYSIELCPSENQCPTN